MTAIQLTGIANDGETLVVPMTMMTDRETVPNEGAINFIDRMLIDAKDPHIRVLKDSGYLVCMPRVARTGIQLYRGSEVGKPTMDVVRVYRPEAAVFDKASLLTFAYKPITDDHPPEMVTSDNWRKFSRGNAGSDIMRDGIFVRTPMTVMDKDVIGKVVSGKAEISVGYSCDLKWTPGIDTEGQAYDAVQSNIHVNHIAIVDAARGGDKLRIGDDNGTDDTTSQQSDNEGAETMNDKTTNGPTLVTMDVDSIPCQMTDVSAAAVKRKIKALEEEADGLKKQLQSEKDGKAEREKKDAESITKLTADLAARDAEVTTLKTQVADAAMTPAKLDALVKDRATVTDKAKIMLPTVVLDGKSESEIRRQVVDAKLGEAAKGWTDEQIKTSFDTLAASVPTTGNGGQHVQHTHDAFSRPGYGGNTAAMYEQRDKKLSDAWKNPGSDAKQ